MACIYFIYELGDDQGGASRKKEIGYGGWLRGRAVIAMKICFQSEVCRFNSRVSYSLGNAVARYTQIHTYKHSCKKGAFQ